MRVLRRRILASAFVTVGLLAAVASAADVPASQPMRVHLWWTQVSMADKVLDRAR